MKKLLLAVLLLANIFKLYAQTETVIPPSNRSATNLEKNLLFYADRRFSVSQSGPASFSLAGLFDGNYEPQYSGAMSGTTPYVVTIENLPNVHVQAGAWVGWTTRYYNPVHFKIEAYNVYDYGGVAGVPAPNTWITVAEETSYSGGSYIAQVGSVSATKLRFTFYTGSGPSGNIGISELFFIHPEATSVYDGVMVKYTHDGKVGIGTDAPDQLLSVNGTIHSKEVKVDLVGWPDFVFKPVYKLPSLTEVKQYIDKNQHLPEIPSAHEAEKNGVNLGEMNKLLLKKVEELTLYIIQLKGEVDTLKQKTNRSQQLQIDSINSKLKLLLKK